MTEKTDVSAIRTAYELGQLSERNVSGNPFEQFRKWFDEAIEKQVMEPNAMVLSTVSDAGVPSSRVVLLKQLDGLGFGFFTNYESQKGKELFANPNAALLFFWPELQRQVRIVGRVAKMSAELSDDYFYSRPKGSQLGAIASPQSREIKNRKLLDDRLAALEHHYSDHETVPRPEHWGGYTLEPDMLEFWQGRGNRLHDRLCYRRQDVRSWQLTRLAP